MDRSLFYGSPAFFTHNAIATQMHQENWSLRLNDRTMERSTNLQGYVGDAKDYSIGTLTFDPVVTSGNLASLLTYLFPYSPNSLGNLVFPQTDLHCAPGQNLFQGAELTCLIANNSDGTGATDFVQDATSTYTEPTLDPLTIMSSLFGVAYGAASPLNAIETDENGVVFEPDVQLEECRTSNGGLLNYRVARVGWKARFTPVNISEADFFSTLAKLDNSVGRGKMVGTRGLAFTVTGAGTGSLIVTMPLGVPVSGDEAEMRFGRQGRFGEITIKAQRKFASSVWQPLLSLSQAA
jgi:hypothetical protein